MISEPELEGQWEPVRPAEVAQGAGPPRERPPGRPWQWVLAAVLATSTAWAGGLYLYGDRLTAPEIGHRTTDNLCAQMELAALGEVLDGFLASSGRPTEGRHEVLDRAACSRSGAPAAGEESYFVQAEVELHKKSDPAAEFAVGTTYDWMYSEEGTTWEPVPGLGDEALVNTPGESDEDDLRLRVRAGGAVFTLHLVFLGDGPAPDEQDGDGGEPVRPRPDRQTLKTAMAKDMRALMAALEK
ncbi:hypothetical protein ACFWUZ_31545 [Streptomyces sp. NPDC058646]|uniref:hypothetical protein n=1 Tax=Streptomyces sp. NPDC058646 TaxID=3346574 RepID=UPI003650BB0F